MNTVLMANEQSGWHKFVTNVGNAFQNANMNGPTTPTASSSPQSINVLSSPPPDQRMSTTPENTKEIPIPTSSASSSTQSSPTLASMNAPIQQQTSNEVAKESEFHQLFPNLVNEKLVANYSCAIQDKVLVQGRMYITEQHICFSSMLTHATQKTIPFSSVRAIIKKNTVLVFPNAIEIQTPGQKYFFGSFLFRDQAFQSLRNAWQHMRKSLPIPPHFDLQGREAATDLSEEASDNSFEELSDVDSDGLSEEESPESKDGSPLKFPMRKSNTLGTRTRYEHKSFDGFHFEAKKDEQQQQLSQEQVSDVRRRSNSWNAVDVPVQLMQKSASVATMSPSHSPATPQNKSETSTQREAVKPPPVQEKKVEEVVPPTPGAALPPVSGICQHLHQEDPSSPPEYYINEMLPLSLSQFFVAFLADKSDFWLTTHHASTFTENTFTPWLVEAQGCCIYRNITFMSPLSAMMIGFKLVKVSSTHRCSLRTSDTLIMEATSATKDVPSGDCFYMLNKIVLTARGTDSCLLQVSSQVKWLKKVWAMKGLIEKTATDSAKDFYFRWMKMLKERLASLPAPIVLPESVSSTDLASQEAEAQKQDPSSPTFPLRRLSASPAAPLAIRGKGKPTPSTSPVDLLQTQHMPSTVNVYSPSTGGWNPSWLHIAGGSALLLLFLIAFMSSLSRLSTVEREQAETISSIRRLEDRIGFLQVVIEELAVNVTGSRNRVEELKKEWHASKNIAAKYHEWEIKILSLQHELQESQSLLQQLNPHPSQKVENEGFSWWWTLLVPVLLGIVFFLLLINKQLFLRTSTPTSTSAELPRHLTQHLHAD